LKYPIKTKRFYIKDGKCKYLIVIIHRLYHEIHDMGFINRVSTVSTFITENECLEKMFIMNKYGKCNFIFSKREKLLLKNEVVPEYFIL